MAESPSKGEGSGGGCDSLSSILSQKVAWGSHPISLLEEVCSTGDDSQHVCTFRKVFFTAVQSICLSASRVAELKPVLACGCKGDGEEWTNSGA